MSPGLGKGSSSGRGESPGGVVPPGMRIVESAGGQGMGRPVTGSKHPSIIFALPVSWHGGSPREFEVNQPWPLPHEVRQPVTVVRSAAPIKRAEVRRNIAKNLVAGGFGHPGG